MNWHQENPNLPEDEIVWYFVWDCPKCGNRNNKWNGHRKTKNGLKHRRLCKRCGTTYTNQQKRCYKKNTLQNISLTLD